jgi:hypothetical protein
LRTSRKVVLLLALGTVILLCLDENAVTEILKREPQRGHRRPWDARSSLFRLGMGSAVVAHLAE